MNRNQIGAVVGSQPFGGEGLSGTGPKAGGPNYLRRFRRGPTPSGSFAKAEPIATETLEKHLPDPVKEGWNTRADRIAELRKHLRGKGGAALAAAAAFEYGPIDLPGPTGEANTLFLVARGRVLCLGSEPATLTAQVTQALAAGNAVLAVTPDARDVLKPLLGKGLPLEALDGTIHPYALRDLPLDLAAYAGEEGAVRVLRRALGARNGAIVPLVSEVINPAAYAHERAVCVDTTAAGGNASLLAAS